MHPDSRVERSFHHLVEEQVRLETNAAEVEGDGAMLDRG
jgi:hypothetical protein